MIVDKIKVRRSFSAAADTYDTVAQLQRKVGKTLLESINTATLSGTIVDLGCGTGFLTSEIFSLAAGNLQKMIALDIALPMLKLTRGKLVSYPNIHYVCADVECLPFAEQTIDHLFSNLALQWCSQPDQAFTDMKRILKPDGRLVFSTFGPKTLQELKAAWASVDDYSHVNDFYSKQQLTHALQQAGFKQIRIEGNLYTPVYDSVLTLMRELKYLGAHHVSAGRNPQITGKSHMQRMINTYELFRQSDQLLATFEVFLVSANT